MAFNVGVTGHRKLPVENRAVLADIVQKILASVRQAACDVPERPEVGLVRFSAEERVGLRVISPLAAGADQIVAAAGLGLGYRLQCPLPFAQADYEKSFSDRPPSDLDEFRDLLGRADTVLQLDGDYDAAPDLAYQAAGRAVLTYSDLLIAIWDGGREKGVGGTAQIVREAHSRQIAVVWINPARGNEIGWYGETDGIPQCKPISDFAGPHAGPGLRDVVQRAFAPPAPAPSAGRGKKEASPEKLIELYFQEHRVAHRSKIVRWLGRLWKSFYHHLSPPVGASTFHVPGGPAGKHYHAAEELALHYGNIYRSSFLANYLLAGAAVLMAMLGPVVANFFSEAAVKSCTVLELLSLLAIYVNFRLAGKVRWHDRFTDYRMLAEQLRHLEFVMPLGFVPSARAFGHDPDRPSEHWTTWHVGNLVRQIGILPGNLNNAEYRGELEAAIRDKWIEDQRNYHRDNAERSEILEHRLHGFAIGLFFVTIAACAGHLLAPDEHARWIWISSFLTLLAAVCPAWASSAHAIGQYAELRRLQRRSKAMAGELAGLAAIFERNTALPSRQLNELALRAAEMMLQEAFDWRIQYRMSELMPG
jgi:hypothetical protein